MGGVLGSIIATTAVVLPSFVIILIIAHFLSKFRNSPYVDWAFIGIRPVILGLVASASITVAMDAFVNIQSVIIGVVIFYLITFKKIAPNFGHTTCRGSRGLYYFKGISAKSKNTILASCLCEL